MKPFNAANSQSQMRKGILEFIVLLIISRGRVYASNILDRLKKNELIVVEGTLYPLLSRLKNEGWLAYSWKESNSGPPRKYYSLTAAGKKILTQLTLTWNHLNQSVGSLLNTKKGKYEKNLNH